MSAPDGKCLLRHFGHNDDRVIGPELVRQGADALDAPNVTGELVAGIGGGDRLQVVDDDQGAGHARPVLRVLDDVPHMTDPRIPFRPFAVRVRIHRPLVDDDSTTPVRP